MVLDDGSLIGGLFLIGLTGGFAHCTLMCGPFVLAQVAARLERIPLARMSESSRLCGAALPSYHLGRGVVYTALGAFGGLLAGSIATLDMFRWLPSLLLVLGAAFLLGAAVRGRFPRRRTPDCRKKEKEKGTGWLFYLMMGRLFFPPFVLLLVLPFLGVVIGSGRRKRVFRRFLRLKPVSRLPLSRLRHKGPLSRLRRGDNDISRPTHVDDASPPCPLPLMNGGLLGLCLGFLPCGFLYAALASAAASGSALKGGLGMAAFTLGTMLPLFFTGLFGHIAFEPWKDRLARCTPWLFAINAAVLLIIAWRNLP